MDFNILFQKHPRDFPADREPFKDWDPISATIATIDSNWQRLSLNQIYESCRHVAGKVVQEDGKVTGPAQDYYSLLTVVEFLGRLAKSDPACKARFTRHFGKFLRGTFPLAETDNDHMDFITRDWLGREALMGPLQIAFERSSLSKPLRDVMTCLIDLEKLGQTQNEPFEFIDKPVFIEEVNKEMVRRLKVFKRAVEHGQCLKSKNGTRMIIHKDIEQAAQKIKSRTENPNKGRKNFAGPLSNLDPELGLAIHHTGFLMDKRRIEAGRSGSSLQRQKMTDNIKVQNSLSPPAKRKFAAVNSPNLQSQANKRHQSDPSLAPNPLPAKASTQLEHRVKELMADGQAKMETKLAKYMAEWAEGARETMLSESKKAVAEIFDKELGALRQQVMKGQGLTE